VQSVPQVTVSLLGFPRRRRHFGRYLSFQDVSADELTEWKSAFEYFLRKLALKYSRPLVLKSPPHTGRIRLLLEMFPDAKFVHIHRDPYAVFQSTCNLFNAMFRWQALHAPDPEDAHDWILEHYEEMYDRFFAERSLIPQGSFHEIAFEELEQDPLAELRKLYARLSLSEFEAVEPNIRKYVESLRTYKRNEFPALSPQLKSRISDKWNSTIQEWGYLRA
jgi:omega-hydroxy-beta-dihydromenaquinone-9 sulfotransferase